MDVKPEADVKSKEDVQPNVDVKPNADARQEEQKGGTSQGTDAEAAGQEAAGQAVNSTAYTEIQDYNTPLAGPDTVLTIRSVDKAAELTFLKTGKYEIKSPDGSDGGRFEKEDGQIVLTSETGKKMFIGQDGRLEYSVGNINAVFEFTPAIVEMLIAVVK